MRLLPLRFASWVLGIVGCSAPVIDPDDDVTAEDDDSAPLESCPDGVHPIDPTDGTEVLKTVIASSELRFVSESFHFGLTEADSGCPLRTGDAEEVEAGSADWTGPCLTAAGVHFEGNLRRSWDRSDPAAWTEVAEASGWAVSGGAAFLLLELDGRWESTHEPGPPERRSEQWTGVMSLAGEFRGSIAAVVFPWGFDGGYTWEGVWPDDAGRDVHHFAAEGRARCRADVVIDLQIVQTPGVCANGLPDGGRGQLTTGGHDAILDLGGGAPCEGCWPWTLDGLLQPEPICMSGR